MRSAAARRRRAATALRGGSRIGYVGMLVVLPLGAWCCCPHGHQRLRARSGPADRALRTGDPRLRFTVADRHCLRRSASTRLRRRRGAAAGPLPTSRGSGCSARSIDLPVAGLADRRRPGPGAGLRPDSGWFGAPLHRRRHPGHLRRARAWSWPPSSCRCRSWCARSCRCSRRPASSRSRRRAVARRQRVAAVPADHAARRSAGRSTYGVVLSIARCLGEFGAVKVVSGNISGPDRDGDRCCVDRPVREPIKTRRLRSVAFVLIAIAVLAIVVVVAVPSEEQGPAR